MNVVNLIRSIFSLFYNRILLYRYRLSIPSKVKRVRQKSKIKVLFVVSEISIWKTEALYCEMLKHARFEPILGVVLITADKPCEAKRKYEYTVNYLNYKKYEYIELFGNDIKRDIKPDIIFYQQPYDGFIDSHLFFYNNRDSLFCNVYYAFNTIGQKWIGASRYLHYCWQIYYENQVSLNYCESTMPRLTRNKARLTGLSFQDILEMDKKEFKNPWKLQDKEKKRIIWAPHHTIPTASNLLEYSTFLNVADMMLEIAEEFKEEIQIAFKPHPFLLKKLYNVWGKDKTDAYYNKWSQLANTQFEIGEYYGLFKYSDALIHDCGSFTIEYLYTGNPVMYLSNGKPHTETLNEFGKAAYDTHVIGCSKNEIVNFICDVVNGIDNLKNERNQFKIKYLSIPESGNASLNIINSILYK